MSFPYGTEEYYKKIIELQDKLRKSEEERLTLEMKYHEMFQAVREEQETNYRKFRSHYKKVLEENKLRQDRNERILRTLDSIENRASVLAAKTERFKNFRQEYLDYLKRVSVTLKPAEQNLYIQQDLQNIQRNLKDIQDNLQNIPRSNYNDVSTHQELPGNKPSLYDHPAVQRALLWGKNKTEASIDSKPDIFDKYLQSFPSEGVKGDVLQRSRYTPHGTSENFLNDGNEKVFADGFAKLQPYNTADDRNYVQYHDEIPSQSKMTKDYRNSLRQTVPGDDIKTGSEFSLISNKTNDVILPREYGSNIQDYNPDKQLYSYSPKNAEFFERHRQFLEIQQRKTEQLKNSNSLQDNDIYKSPIYRDPYSYKQQDHAVSPSKFLDQQSKESSQIISQQTPMFKDHIENNVEQRRENSRQLPQKTFTRRESIIQPQTHSESARKLSVEQHEANILPKQHNRYENGHFLIQDKVDSQNTSPDAEYSLEKRNGLYVEQQREASEYENRKDSQSLQNQNQAVFPDTKINNVDSPIEYIETSTHDIQQQKHRNNSQQQQELLEHKTNEDKVKQIDVNIESDQNSRINESLPQHSEEKRMTQKTEDTGRFIEEKRRTSIQQSNELKESSHLDENKQPLPSDQHRQSIQHDANEEPKQYDENRQTVQYDENGQPIQYDEHGQSIQYDENGQPIRYDDNGQPIQYDENRQLVQYDENGQPVQYDQNGQPIQYEENEQPIQYDDNGQPIQYDEKEQPIRYDQNGQQLQYDENGQPIQYDENGQPVRYDQNRQQLQYDENGQPIQYDENGQPVQYDQNGQPIQYDENGQPIQYDDNGQPIQYDENGQPVQYDQNGQQIQYDQNGQPIQYDENGQPIQYDQNGQPLQYDENGQPIQYDQNGQPLQYDENGQPIQYDENGQPLQYDENGQPLQPYNDNTQYIQQYDENGQPLQQYDENGQPYYGQNTIQYDENGQPLQNYNISGQLQGYDENVPLHAEPDNKLQPTDTVPVTNDGNTNLEEKKPNVLDLLDTDTESSKQDTKISNDSDFDFSNVSNG